MIKVLNELLFMKNIMKKGIMVMPGCVYGLVASELDIQRYSKSTGMFIKIFIRKIFGVHIFF